MVVWRAHHQMVAAGSQEGFFDQWLNGVETTRKAVDRGYQRGDVQLR